MAGQNGVLGITKLSSVIGAIGISKASNQAYGVFGMVTGTTGAGVYGLANGLSGDACGVLGEATSYISFDYRIMARRLGYEGKRLQAAQDPTLASRTQQTAAPAGQAAPALLPGMEGSQH